jgi:hypothetical protein
MPAAVRASALAAAAALVGCLLVVVASAPASAYPTVCTDKFGASWDNVFRWVGGFSANWSDPSNWAHGTGDVAGIPTTTGIVCVEVAVPSVVDLAFSVDALYLGPNAAVTVSPGRSLLVTGPDPSVWDTGSTLTVNKATFGGSAPIQSGGLVSINAESTLTSVPANPGDAWAGTRGTMTVTPTGVLSVEAASFLSLLTRYALDVQGTLQLTDGDGYLTADGGTSTTLEPGAVFDLQGDGGYYQGSPVPGQTIGSLTNAGTILKSNGSNASVIDAAYTQTATGTVRVDSGTLVLPDTDAIAGLVAPGSSLGTGVCGADTLDCPGTADPAVDAMSVTFHVPASNGGGTLSAIVHLQELGPVSPVIDSRSIGNEVLAHADQLAVAADDPATIYLRFGQADVMATPLDEIQVAHTSDAGVTAQVPDCVGGKQIPAGQTSCVVRPVTRTAQFTFVQLLTSQTSRWHLRRTLAGQFQQTAPGPPSGLTAARAAPFDGSVVHVSWAAPTADGGAAVTAYQVLVDGTKVATTTATGDDLRDLGPGAHTLAVSAVNIVGAGAAATVSITLPKLSKPRKVTALQGRGGGRATAGAKWRPPAGSGGMTITKYAVAVFEKGVGKLAVKKVPARIHRLMLRLRPGRYQFEVRARTADGWGPWSRPTTWVRPRGPPRPRFVIGPAGGRSALTDDESGWGGGGGGGLRGGRGP